MARAPPPTAVVEVGEGCRTERARREAAEPRLFARRGGYYGLFALGDRISCDSEGLGGWEWRVWVSEAGG